MRKEVSNHYAKIANELGESKQSTMMDTNIRDLEVEKIISTLNTIITYYKEPRILEIGCGNGYLATKIVSETNARQLVCIDASKEMIHIAKNRGSNDIDFKTRDVLQPGFKDNSFDIIISERCLINLENWEDQKKAINEIHRLLRKNGCFIMVESFIEGFNNLNEARKSVDLEETAVPFHNVYFQEQQFFDHIRNMFVKFYEDHPDSRLENTESFLSTYYFGSRVIYSSLIKGKPIEYNNKFIEFFRYLPNYGNYGAIKMFVLKKED